jgi:hypothetical protein
VDARIPGNPARKGAGQLAAHVGAGHYWRPVPAVVSGFPQLILCALMTQCQRCLCYPGAQTIFGWRAGAASGVDVRHVRMSGYFGRRRADQIGGSSYRILLLP